MENVRLVFFWDFWGLFGREPPLLAVGARAGSGRGAGLGRVGAVWDAPRGCTPDWRTSAPSPDRGRVSLRGSRAGRSAALFGVWRKTRPSHGGSSFSPRREGSRAGSRATRRTVLPRGSRGMRGGRTGGMRFGGGCEVRLGGGASACPQRLRRLVVVTRRFFEVRSWRPTSGRGDFERNRRRPAGRDRPAERRGPTRERTPGNFPDTSKLASFLAVQPARRVFGPVSAARVEPTRRGERRVAMAARDGHDAPDSA